MAAAARLIQSVKPMIANPNFSQHACSRRWRAERIVRKAEPIRVAQAPPSGRLGKVGADQSVCGRPESPQVPGCQMVTSVASTFFGSNSSARNASAICCCFDTSDADAPSHALNEHRPWAVIHLPRYLRASRTENMANRLSQDDAAGAERLALACAERNLPLVTFSSDLVFDGQAGRPYLEHDAVNPVGVYGAAMHKVERCVLDASALSLVIRSGALFGPWDKRNFVWGTLHAAAHGRKMTVDSTQIVSPTYMPDLVGATLDLLLDGECGLWHVANPAEINWYDFAVEVVTRTKFDPSLVRRPKVETQRRNIALSSARAVLLQPLDAALSAYFRDAEPRWSAE